METNNLLDAELKTLVIRLPSDLSENFNKVIGNLKMEIENIKKDESEMKTTVTEMKNTFQVINCRGSN